MKQPKTKLLVDEQLAKKVAGVAATELRTLEQQLAYWVSNYEAKHGTVVPREVGPVRAKHKPSAERVAKMREQGLKLAALAKAAAAARRAAVSH
jgi:hypothetical protein